jgi:hypothetical protein
MIGMYIALGALLFSVSLPFFILYCALFVTVAIAQSYVCAYFQCPYVGKFAPCVGGFCLPSSQIARGFKDVKKSKRTYDIVVNVAFAAFLGIILLPIYFLYQQNPLLLLAYVLIVMSYAVGFLGFICPVCATRHVCPGGQTSTKLRGFLGGRTN